MRTAAKLGVLGLGVLLSARIVAGCSSGQGEAGFDAGGLDEVELPGPDATSAGDTSTVLQEGDGGDATVASDEDSGSPMPGVDGGSEASTEPGDASDAGSEVDANDGSASLPSDAGDADASVVDAGDASITTSDAGADAGADAGIPDAGTEDSSLPTDASVSTDASDATTSEDAGFEDADSVDASDAAPACVSCGTTMTFLGNTAAFVTGTSTSVSLTGGTAPDGDTVSAITQTYPQGSAASVHVVYATSSTFANATDVVMAFDHTSGNNDQWYTILPSQPASTTVYWYVYADGCDCSTVLYDPGNFQNFTYTEQ
jgi:hypothetical protein